MTTRIDALYARQSLDRKDSLSIESQLDFCRYETRGEPFQVYIDRGYSGKNINRPGFEQMMADLRRNRIKRIIVYKLDRISRSILDFSNMMEIFQSYQVEFISSTEKFDTSTPIGRAMLNICIIFAQLERETIQKRISDAYYSRSQKGFYMGGRIPYGFQLKQVLLDGIHTSVFAAQPSEAQQVQYIFQTYAEGHISTTGLLRQMEQNGMVKLRGAPFQSSRISELLRNPVYVKADLQIYRYLREAGYVTVNPPEDYAGTNGVFLYSSKNPGRENDPDSKTAVLAPHPGLVDAATWMACQKQAAARRYGSEKKPRSWLAGLIRCRSCGRCLSTTCAGPKTCRYFQCLVHNTTSTCQRSKMTLYAAEIENYVWRRAEEKLAGLYPGRNPDPQPSPEWKRAAATCLIKEIWLDDDMLQITWNL